MPVKSKLFDTTLWYKILPIMSILAKCKLMWMFELQNYLGYDMLFNRWWQIMGLGFTLSFIMSACMLLQCES